MTTTYVTTKLISNTCWSCGMTYGMPEEFVKQRRKDHKAFYCPGCRESTYYFQKSDVELLQDKLASAESSGRWQAAQRRTAELSLAATKGVITKMKKRSAAGVCPCCNRTFKQLAAHMKNKHPKYAETKS